ncbi:mitochondrial ribosomal protein L17 [Brevipalpus obovatus]|uniref:mitochondrial ribosomal protein L17 n=1 Tax=Brevipalpus obovatus TaxID=246614 RepID=UPI003D9F5C7D
MVRFFNKQLIIPPTPHRKLIPALPPDVTVHRKPIKLRSKWFIQERYRLYPIAFRMTELFKYERVKYNYYQCVALREYAERLIADAIRYGDKHIPTMERADFFLTEKQLVHKLFKVLVPRYIDYDTSFTKLWRLSITNDVDFNAKPSPKFTREGKAVLELKDNPLPPIIPPTHSSKKYYLTNILLDAAKQDFINQKKAQNNQSDDSKPDDDKHNSTQSDELRPENSTSSSAS